MSSLSGGTLRLDAVSFQYPGGDPILRDVDLHLAPGWHGLVGDNGAGKTTLLRLLQGALEPVSGAIHGARRIALCPQRVEHVDATTAAFGLAWDKGARRWRSRLGLDVDDLERWATLSQGERKRWQVGAALWSEPAVLLLDEPTNHLDAEGQATLVEALQTHRGIGVVVTHDRALLATLAPKTLWLERGALRILDLPYAEARAQRRQERATQVEEHAKRRRAERHLARSLAARERIQAAAERGQRTSARMKSSQDSDAREAGRKGRAAKAAQAAAQAVGALKSRLDRAQVATAATRVRKERGGSIDYEAVLSPKETVVHVDETLHLGARRLAVRVTLRRRDRVHLAGPNGAGKSTVLRHLASRLAGEEVAHLPQELSEAAVAEMVDRLHRAPAGARGRLLQLAARLGADPDALLQSQCLSPGEARKLWLATTLGDPVHTLLLDEPTNHFDVATIERLEEALADFPGALVLVSHDAVFAEALTDQRWRLEEGQLVA